MKALKMLLRYCSSCYKEKTVQGSSFTYSTLMFSVMKACLRDVVFFFFFFAL